MEQGSGVPVSYRRDDTTGTRPTIVAIEKQSYSPSLELAFRIARAFGRTIEDVFSFDEDKDVGTENEGSKRKYV
ncbi:MAG: transcriptional regulator [Spirochaetaceae bacterium]|nr:MAG: transcriptional regulator [Spirochaetaceae bacterium]